MKDSFDQMPDDARLWVYQCNRKFLASELEAINSALQEFLASWVAHGTALKPAYALYYDQIIVLAVDESSHGASGCSIDTSVAFMKSLEQTYGVSLLDRTEIGFMIDQEIRVLNLSKIKESIASDKIKAEDIILNNAVSSVAEFKKSWHQSVDQSWCKKYFT
ncbi:MAG: hypothetical protein QMB12_05410 [Cyclobacteriaceae bacterium]|jgi:hypothetical protein